MNVSIVSHGKNIVLKLGEEYSSVPDKVYYDAPIELIELLTSEIKSGKDWIHVVEENVKPKNPWLSKIITHEKRNKFLELIPEFTSDYLCLDAGSGWGQHTVELAKRGKVCSVEPSPERFQFMRAVLSQNDILRNCYSVNASVNDIEFLPTFDFAISIGVLEWVGKFVNHGSPIEAQKDFLRRIHRSLKTGAPLIIGIENRIGLKYLLGEADDHIGVSHIGCRNYHSANSEWKKIGNDTLSVATHTLREYVNLFEDCGFNGITVFGALPDYKIPEAIVECYPVDQLSEYVVSNSFIAEHNGCNGKSSEYNGILESLYIDLAKSGIANHFAPSYFIIGRK